MRWTNVCCRNLCVAVRCHRVCRELLIRCGLLDKMKALPMKSELFRVYLGVLICAWFAYGCPFVFFFHIAKKLESKNGQFSIA